MGNERSGVINCVRFQDHLCKYQLLKDCAIWRVKDTVDRFVSVFPLYKGLLQHRNTSPTAVLRDVLKQSSRPRIHYKCRPSRKLLANKLNPITSLMRIHVRADAHAHKHQAFTFLTGKSNSKTWRITTPLHCSAVLLTHMSPLNSDSCETSRRFIFIMSYIPTMPFFLFHF